MAGCCKFQSSCNKLIDLHYCDSCRANFQQIINYEASISSTRIEFKGNEVQRERDSIISHSWGGYGSDDTVYFIRPKAHPFLKEVVCYWPPGFIGKAITKYYYRDNILDSLIPEDILKQYENDTFNLEEFICFKESLLFTNDRYYNVGKKCFSDGSKKFIPCRRETEQNDFWDCFPKKYHWLKKHMKYYEWWCCKGVTRLTVLISTDVYKRQKYELRDGTIIDNDGYIRRNSKSLPIVREFYDVNVDDLAIFLSWDYKFDDEWWLSSPPDRR